MKMKMKRLALISAFFIALIFGASASANTNGIDVASYQGSDRSYFTTFKQRGDKFAIVKLGGRGGGEGAHYQNPKASAQLINADKAGMQTAGYFWGEFGDDVTDAQYSATLAVSDAKAAGLLVGSYIALDYEAGAGPNYANNTSAILAFMDEIKAQGYKPMLYSGKYYMQARMDVSRVNERYPNALWVASYPTTDHQAGPNMSWFPAMSNIKIWQYADNHYGVDGNVMVVGSLDNEKPVSSVTTKPYKPVKSTVGKKTYYATFDGVFVADKYEFWNNHIYSVNRDMGIPVIDYNNYIPISAMTMTNRYGTKLKNQHIQGNNGVVEFFTLTVKYKVLAQTETAVKVQIAGEPVWLKKAFVTIK